MLGEVQVEGVGVKEEELATSRILPNSYFGEPEGDVHPYKSLQKYVDENRAFGEERALLLYGYPYALGVELMQLSTRETTSYLERGIAIETADRLFEFASLNYLDFGLKSRQLG
jgi:hypothetical protein